MAPAPEAFSTLTTDGVRIVADRLGDPSAPAVVFLHGGGQTRRSWARAAAAEFRARFPEIEFIDVGGAGHMVAGDRNDVFADAVVGFLSHHAAPRDRGWTSQPSRRKIK
jgi:pimeloyl-ACP methyl ester carboxylesterase